MGLLARLIARWSDEQKRRDYRAGIGASATLNTIRSKETDRVWEPADFFPGLAREPEPQTEEDMLMSMQMWAASLNSKAARA